jgi:hypothetical protein
VSKAVSKKADAKKTSAKLKLKAIADGSHGIDGGIYTYKKGDTVTLSKKAHYDSMKELACFNEV